MKAPKCVSPHCCVWSAGQHATRALSRQDHYARSPVCEPVSVAVDTARGQRCDTAMLAWGERGKGQHASLFAVSGLPIMAWLIRPIGSPVLILFLPTAASGGASATWSWSTSPYQLYGDREQQRQAPRNAPAAAFALQPVHG
jgi:hypothetical protein